MTNVCIVGVGLIGGSLGMALRRVRRGGKKAYRVFGLGRSSASLRLAKRRGALDDFSVLAPNIIPSADIVVLCVPVHLIVPLVKKIRPYLKRGAVLSDVGSVKHSITSKLKPLLAKRKDIQFVGGHPLAGSEKTGAENAELGLFRKASVVLTKNGASAKAFGAVKRMWADVGGRPALLSSVEHDRILSLTSHLPHLLAFSLFWLTQSAARKNRRIKSLVAGSFRDMTRIAASDPVVWTGILSHNRESIRTSTREFLGVLNRLVSTPDSKLSKVLRSITQAKKAW